MADDDRPARGLFQTDIDPSDLWSLGKIIGKGAFGFVHIATCTQDAHRQAAVKLISIEEQNEVETIRKEVKILKSCNHPNIVTFDNTYIQGETMWLVMEFCGGGAVSDLLRFRCLKECEIATVLCESLCGLFHLHQQRVLHRDFKSANLLLTRKGEIKVADFGVSKILDTGHFKTKTFVGTPHWMAPEIIEGKEYDAKCDLWSVGIVGIELAEQNPPKYQINMHGVLAAIPKAPPPTLQEPSQWSTTFQLFLSKLLVKDPADRVAADQALALPFLVDAAVQRRGHASLVSLIDRVCDAKSRGKMPAKPRRRAVRQGNFSTQSLRESHQSVEKETHDTRTDENDRLLGNWDTSSTRRTNASTFATGFTSTRRTFQSSSSSKSSSWSSLKSLKSLKTLSDSGRRRQQLGSSSSLALAGVVEGEVEDDVAEDTAIKFESENPFLNGNELQRTVDHTAAVGLFARPLEIVEEAGEEDGEEQDEEEEKEAVQEHQEHQKHLEHQQLQQHQQHQQHQRVLDMEIVAGEMDLQLEEEMWDDIVLKRVSMGFNDVGSSRMFAKYESESEMPMTSSWEDEKPVDEMTPNVMMNVLIQLRSDQNMVVGARERERESEDPDVQFMRDLLIKYGVEEEEQPDLVSWL